MSAKHDTHHDEPIDHKREARREYEEATHDTYSESAEFIKGYRQACLNAARRYAVQACDGEPFQYPAP